MYYIFKLQPYLYQVNIDSCKIALSRLRMSAHNLEIEAGRWKKPKPTPRENRTCCICHKLEDEFHLLLECQLYTELRKTYINKYYCQTKRTEIYRTSSVQ